jgi:hypothetical protein
MFNIYLGAFIVIALAVIVGGTFELSGSNQTIGAILFFLGAIVVFIVYYLKWFGSINSMLSNTPVSWPPVINTCPDYLVYYKRTKADGTSQDSCIDTIGVSKNGALKVFPTSGTPPVSDEYYFSLTTQSSDPTAKNAELCQRAMTFGLTWEGITNGESCMTPAGPVAPSGGGGAGGCPSF